VSRFAADRAPTVGRPREALDGRLRHPVVGEHPCSHVALDDLEHVVEVVPTDVLPAENGKHLLNVGIAPGEFGPLARLHRGSDELHDLDASVGPRPFDLRTDLAVHADRRRDVDEVLFRTALVDEHGRCDPGRGEAPELDA